MRRAGVPPCLVALCVVGLASAGCAGGGSPGSAPPPGGAGIAAQTPAPRDALSATGRNPYFVLEPGYQMTYASGSEALVVTVLDRTEVVDSVATRVVEERETKNGAPVEISRNYFAIDPASKDVYYFGEDVDEYQDGKVSAHGGSWRAGVGGARYGLVMPGRPQAGFQHDQEIAPGVAMDHSEIVSTTETVAGPSGPLTGCVKVKETTPLEPGVVEYKSYAPGVGQVRDGDLALVRYGPGR
jgi:hypothetical protein